MRFVYNLHTMAKADLPDSSGDERMTTARLFEPVELGGLALRNRIVMAPLTRSRALPDGSAHPSAPLYYAQRAEAGLIVTEGTCISPEGVGHPYVPGIWSEQQIGAWRKVVDAVHARG